MINFCEVIEISYNLSFLLNFETSRLLGRNGVRLLFKSPTDTILQFLSRFPFNSPHPKIAPDFDNDPEFEENKHSSVPLYR